MDIICKICNKEYKSYQSRSNHTRKYHNTIISQIQTYDKPNDKPNIINEKEKIIICDKCDLTFIDYNNYLIHNSLKCRPSINCNNIYTFDKNTFGKNKYKEDKGGDIYIIQTEFNINGFYKIGITTNLYNRISNYRCGNPLEPKLHFYYPCKNIKITDKILKDKLKKYNIKREIYKAENINDLRIIIKDVQIISNSELLEIEPENKESEIRPCNNCNKIFTNIHDLRKHNKIYHLLEEQKYVSEANNNLDKINENKLKCNYCTNYYSNRHSKWKHQQKCKLNFSMKDNKLNCTYCDKKYLNILCKLKHQNNCKFNIELLQKENKKLKSILKNIDTVNKKEIEI